MILTSKKIPYERKDIAAGGDALKIEMREFSGAGTLPPQLVNGDKYIGDYSAFETAVENEELEKFLQL